MSVDRPLEIVAYDFDVPEDYYPIPLVRERDIDSVDWAGTVINQVIATTDEPGTTDEIADELVDLRTRLLATEDPWLTALVSIRPEDQFSIGCLLTAEQFAMDPDDGPDAFEGMLREATVKLRPGARTRAADIWRSQSPVGEIVGLAHSIDYIELGADEGHIEQRTVFGLFPPRSSDMIRFEFTVSDLATYLDMPRETQAVVETVRVRTEEKVA